eukprot:scaffold20310_cov125-Isochrysis_galbana.AAC.14
MQHRSNDRAMTDERRRAGVRRDGDVVYAIRPEGRHDRAAALCASVGERACAAMGTLWNGKGGSVENKMLN